MKKLFKSFLYTALIIACLVGLVVLIIDYPMGAVGFFGVLTFIGLWGGVHDTLSR